MGHKAAHPELPDRRAVDAAWEVFVLRGIRLLGPAFSLAGSFLFFGLYAGLNRVALKWKTSAISPPLGAYQEVPYRIKRVAE
jgi:hypothetical protein